MEIYKTDNTDIMKNVFSFLDLYNFKNEIENEMSFNFDNHHNPDLTYRFNGFINSTFMRIKHNNYHFTISIYSYNKDILEIIFNKFDNDYQLDFNFYKTFKDKLNIIYNENDFFDNCLSKHFGEKWIDFMPSKRSLLLNENFSRVSKVIHKISWEKDISMLVKDKIILIKIKLPSGKIKFLPAVKVALPISKNYKKVIIISASKNHDFCFQFNNGKYKYIEKEKIDLFIKSINTSILKYYYKSLSKRIDMSKISFKKFISLPKNELKKLKTLAEIIKY
jgi:hypothetical protein